MAQIGKARGREAANFGVNLVNAPIVPRLAISHQRAGSQADHADAALRRGQRAHRAFDSSSSAIIGGWPGGLSWVDELQAVRNAAVLKQKMMLSGFILVVLINFQDAVKISRLVD